MIMQCEHLIWAFQKHLPLCFLISTVEYEREHRGQVSLQQSNAWACLQFKKRTWALNHLESFWMYAHFSILFLTVCYTYGFLYIFYTPFIDIYVEFGTCTFYYYTYLLFLTFMALTAITVCFYIFMHVYCLSRDQPSWFFRVPVPIGSKTWKSLYQNLL